MSRSYHITKREATRRLVTEGDVGAVVNYAEKSKVKKFTKLFREAYVVDHGHPFHKPRKKLRSDVMQRAVRQSMKPKAPMGSEG